MIEVMKASAGSGKTYQLTGTYLDCLFAGADKHAYRHILAVTFTNKATAEMKNRILSRLHERSATDPRAGEMLVSILHDYGSFSICTIDKFFQQALRAFARELGYFGAYQVELDTDSVVREAVDRILDNISENDTELLAWIDDAVTKQLADGDKVTIEKDLYDICSKLKASRQSPEVLSKENLAAQRALCEKIVKDFRAKVERLSPGFLDRTKSGKRIEYPGVRALKAEVPELKELFENEYSNYLTAFIVHDLTYSLGIAREFYNSFDDLVREKNIMCLDDSNTLLKNIIDGSDTPFIYEKMGVRFHNFLIDEFQDTSSVQWANLYPLLKESDDAGNTSLVVGDIKQSIYRWRGSDWKLLDRQLPAQFPAARIQVLDNNYRSAPQIVNFNNSFFKYAASVLGLDSLYSDVEQHAVAEEPQGGNVDIRFCPKDEELQEVLLAVEDALARGAEYSDIAVLVRGKEEGGEVADALITGGYPVITDDSLMTKSSLTVRRLTALLGCMENEDDGICRYYVQSLGMEYPEDYRSLTDLCESLLRGLVEKYPEDAAGEVLHIQSFMDDLADWTSLNGNNISAFLEYWKTASVKISSPASSNSIRIMTIHKSKGLEFPYVIFPFAEKVSLFKAGTTWCTYNGVSYPVLLTKKSAPMTMFADDFRKEVELQTVDNLNIFYVALTRAVKSLTVIAKEAPKALKDNLDKGKSHDYADMSQILYAYASKRGFTYGKPYDFSLMPRHSGYEKTIESAYVSYPIGSRLTIPDDSYDFFGPDGVGTRASARLNGVALHAILSQVRAPGDLRRAVDGAVRDGRISPEEGEKDFALLSAAIESQPQWFGPGLEVMNEVTVIGDDGQLHRPDRVVLKDGCLYVVDYKLGAEKPSYRRQVGEYMRLFRAMGYKDVRGYLWYVPENRVQEVR